MTDAYAPDHRRLPAQPCPSCGHPLDAVTQAGAPATEYPEPGDETVCLRCTTVLVFGPLGELQVEPPPQISAQAMQVQADLQAFQRQYPRRGDTP